MELPHVGGGEVAESYPDRALLQAALPRFDAATQAVALGVIVDGLQPAQVAVALGVSRRTVARKLTRFLAFARQHAAVAVAAVALAGCPGKVEGSAPPMRSIQPGTPQAPRTTVDQADGGGRANEVGEGRAASGGAERLTPHDRDGRADLAEEVHAVVAKRMRRHGTAMHGRVARAVLAEAKLASLDPLLVLALIHVESSFDPRAISSAGAMGLMQLREPTMRRETTRSGLGPADPRDPVANVQAGVRYLRRLIDAFGGVDVALMAYNAGPARIRSHLRRGPVPERFHAYPRKVKGELERIRLALGKGARPGSPLAAAQGLQKRPAG